MNDDVTSKNAWDQSVNFIKKLKNLYLKYLGLDLKILVYPVLLIYWGTMLTITFLQ